LELLNLNKMATRKTMKRYDDGGDTPSYKEQKKKAKQDQKLAAITAKTERIKAGTEPSTYEKVSNITGNVANTVGSVAEGVKAVSDARRGANSGGPGGMRKGGSVKRKMQKGGSIATIKSGAKQVARGVKDGIKDSIKGAKTVAKKAVKNSLEYKAYKAAGRTAKSIDDKIEKRYPNYTGKGSLYDGAKQGIKALLGYKTGGMVNPNAKVSKQTNPGSKGVKSGVNPRATASKVARGRVGGTSVAPKRAMPKAQYGMSMRKK